MMAVSNRWIAPKVKRQLETGRPRALKLGGGNLLVWGEEAQLDCGREREVRRGDHVGDRNAHRIPPRGGFYVKAGSARRHRSQIRTPPQEPASRSRCQAPQRDSNPCVLSATR